MLLTLGLIILSAVPSFAGNAAYTTDQSGTIVDQNIYTYGTDVYFNGGPQNQNDQGLPNGLYYFEVTDPSGGTLLSSDPAVCRQVQVINGVVAGSYGPTCKHANGAYNPNNGSTTVQLSPFNATPNNGNEYKAWLIAESAATVSSTNPLIINFKRSDAKTDNFKVEYISAPPSTLSPSSCHPTNSLSILLAQTGVIAYIPNGSWDPSSVTTGVKVVPIQPTGTVSTISTPQVVNSCATNSTTQQTVCTANNTDVYLISGTTLTNTLTSSSNTTASFSGGYCSNCGVAIESNSNRAVITMGYSSAPSGSALQFLDLGTNTFETPIPANNEVSEGVVWDPVGNRILSPNEDGIYDLFELESGATIEYGMQVGGELDSAGVDCLTGVALATTEYANNLMLTDLTQAAYSEGNPATWTAPFQVMTIPEWQPYIGPEAGTDAIAIATGTHYGIIAGEYPFPPSQANAVMAIQLPSTSGTGTPALVDYAVATMPNDPMGYPFDVGCDPHTIAAYVSPTSSVATGVLTDYGPVTCYQGGTPQFVALVNIPAMLAAPRVAGTHTVSSTYDLVGNGVVTYVAAH